MTASRIPWTPPVVQPLDPESDHGRALLDDLEQIAADVEDRLAREAAEHQVRTSA